EPLEEGDDRGLQAQSLRAVTAGYQHEVETARIQPDGRCVDDGRFLAVSAGQPLAGGFSDDDGCVAGMQQALVRYGELRILETMCQQDGDGCHATTVIACVQRITAQAMGSPESPEGWLEAPTSRPSWRIRARPRKVCGSPGCRFAPATVISRDRKSTRLNSSHVKIS